MGSYIKRRGNLLLLCEDAERIHARELEYCIRESLENLRLGQVYTSFNCRSEGTFPPVHIVSVYDFFETMVERMLDDITAMMVNLICCNGKITMNIQMGCSKEIAEQILSDVTIPYGAFTYDIMEEDVVINLAVSEGGDAA